MQQQQMQQQQMQQQSDWQQYDLPIPAGARPRPSAAVVSNANEVQRLPAGEPGNGDSRYEQGGSAASAAAASTASAVAAAVAADKETPPVHGFLYSPMSFTVETCRTERPQQVHLQHQLGDEDLRFFEY
jgi:hypothetical protein